MATTEASAAAAATPASLQDRVAALEKQNVELHQALQQQQKQHQQAPPHAVVSRLNQPKPLSSTGSSRTTSPTTQRGRLNSSVASVSSVNATATPNVLPPSMTNHRHQRQASTTPTPRARSTSPMSRRSPTTTNSGKDATATTTTRATTAAHTVRSHSGSRTRSAATAGVDRGSSSSTSHYAFGRSYTPRQHNMPSNQPTPNSSIDEPGSPPIAFVNEGTQTENSSNSHGAPHLPKNISLALSCILRELLVVTLHEDPKTASGWAQDHAQRRTTAFSTGDQAVENLMQTLCGGILSLKQRIVALTKHVAATEALALRRNPEGLASMRSGVGSGMMSQSMDDLTMMMSGAAQSSSSFRDQQQHHKPHQIHDQQKQQQHQHHFQHSFLSSTKAQLHQQPQHQHHNQQQQQLSPTKLSPQRFSAHTSSSRHLGQHHHYHHSATATSRTASASVNNSNNTNNPATGDATIDHVSDIQNQSNPGGDLRDDDMRGRRGSGSFRRDDDEDHDDDDDDDGTRIPRTTISLVARNPPATNGAVRPLSVRALDSPGSAQSTTTALASRSVDPLTLSGLNNGSTSASSPPHAAMMMMNKPGGGGRSQQQQPFSSSSAAASPLVPKSLATDGRPPRSPSGVPPSSSTRRDSDDEDEELDAERGGGGSVSPHHSQRGTTTAAAIVGAEEELALYRQWRQNQQQLQQ